ncbi:hypothetical protein GCM10010222_09700 [Streptomyces tanashiensis]|nr:hypothetical protein GCM10010222_09700 [Streptomyces tanashiensis]
MPVAATAGEARAPVVTARVIATASRRRVLRVRFKGLLSLGPSLRAGLSETRVKDRSVGGTVRATVPKTRQNRVRGVPPRLLKTAPRGSKGAFQLPVPL